MTRHENDAIEIITSFLIVCALLAALIVTLI